MNKKTYDQLKNELESCRKEIKKLQQQLKTHAAAISKLNKTKQALLESEQKLESLTQEAADAIIIASAKGALFVNKKLIDMLGYSKKELLGATSFKNFVPPDDLSKIETLFRKRLKGAGPTWTYRVRLICKNKKIIPVEISSSFIKWQGQPASFALIRDITERVDIEEKLLLREKLFQLITAMSTEFVNISVENIGKGIYKALQSICEFAGVDRGYIFEFHDHRKKMSNTYEWCAKGIKSQKARLQGLNLDTYTWAVSYFLKNKVLYCPKISELPPEAEPARSEFMGAGIKSLLCVPLIVGKQVKGCMGFDSVKEEKIWEPDLIILLQIAAETVANALERKASEAALRESEEKFFKLFHTSMDPMAISGINSGIFMDVNEAFLKSLKFKKTEVIGNSSSSLNIWIDLKQRNKVISCVKQKGSCKDFEVRIRKKTGEIIHGLFSASSIELTSGPVLFTTLKDITERKHAEQALKESEEKYRTLFNSAGDAVFQVRLNDDMIIDANLECTEMLGYTHTEFLHMSLWDLHPEHERRKAGTLKEQARAYGRFQDVEGFSYLHKKGNLIPVSITCVNIRKSPVPFAIIHVHDITERKQAEAALKESEEKFRTIAEQSIIGIAVVQGMSVVYINQAYADILGYSPDEILEWKPGELFKIIHPDDKDYVTEQASRKEAATIGYIVHYHYRIISKTGETKTISIYSKTINYQGKNAFFVIASDITAQKKAEESLKTSEERLSLALEATNDGLWDWDLVHDTSYTSPRCYEILGTKPGESANVLKRWRDVVCPDYIPEAEAKLQECLSGKTQTFSFEYRAMTYDIKEKWILTRAKVVEYDKQGKPVRIVGTHTDITHQKQMEERLLHSEKMEAIGQLAGGIAHDFNNQLSSIVGYIELLQEGVKDRSELVEYTENIMTATKRASDLTAQLLAFARKGKYQTVPVDVHKTIHEVISLLRHSIDKRIVLTTHLHASPPFILGDPTQLQNALLNLALNARDAMPKGGGMTFSTNLVTLNKQFCKQSPFELRPGEYLKIDVIDAGGGMDKETQKHIFEPFFTTKPYGKGTGMGMAAVYGTVKNHKGAIEVLSTVGRGTTIQLYFPHLTLKTDIKQPPDQKVEIVKGSAHVLLADDEEMIREVGSIMLNSLGYKVSLCANGAEAVELYKKAWHHIDLIILDMVMPKKSGMETFLELKKINPHIKAILSSGYGADSQVQKILKAGVIGFIQKPFRRKDLSDKIIEVLGKNNK
ncbi:MAG: PAS domain S-box protein [Spirochaetales bacterium]|nr:PAS domain S-box protein [Spirochaetales bacterium]